MQALAQDQLRAFSEMTSELDISFNVGVYDGDTLEGDRMWLRDNARLVFLYLWLLPAGYSVKSSQH